MLAFFLLNCLVGLADQSQHMGTGSSDCIHEFPIWQLDWLQEGSVMVCRHHQLILLFMAPVIVVVANEKVVYEMLKSWLPFETHDRKDTDQQLIINMHSKRHGT